jgi:hypothetical protein
MWDRLAADRVDHFIAISDEVRRRIAKVYRREATIIYPPVDVGRFAPSNRVEDYYLFVGRLVPYRRLDLLIEAFNKMGRPLVIAGSGRDRERLEALAGPTVKFLGFVPDADLPDLLARCRAFMWPGEEDFGISPLQANAAGRPVIAYAAGGALETVITGPAGSATGALFAEQSVAAIIEAVESFDPLSVSPAWRAATPNSTTSPSSSEDRRLCDAKVRSMELRQLWIILRRRWALALIPAASSCSPGWRRGGPRRRPTTPGCVSSSASRPARPRPSSTSSATTTGSRRSTSSMA